MLCEICQSNQASVFLTQIVDGNMKKMNLCEACAKEKGVTDPANFALTDLLIGLGMAEALEKDEPEELRCPACGFTQADFKKTGRLGCGTCYDTFADGLAGLLKAMHKGTAHLGKIPSRLLRTLQLDARIQQLRRELETAVARENYEEAARLRDQLRELDLKP